MIPQNLQQNQIVVFLYIKNLIKSF